METTAMIIVLRMARAGGRVSLGGPGGLPGAGGRAVAAQDLGPVAVPRAGGAVGVADQGPAHPVDHHLMVMETEQDAVFQAGLAAVGLVLEVVHVPGEPVIVRG